MKVLRRFIFVEIEYYNVSYRACIADSLISPKINLINALEDHQWNRGSTDQLDAGASVSQL